MTIDPNNSINTQSLGAGKTRQQPSQGPAAAGAKAETAPSKSSDSNDSVSLSSASRAIANLENRVRESADTDTARVAQIKQALESGTYEINAQTIAEKITAEDTSFG